MHTHIGMHVLCIVGATIERDNLHVAKGLSVKMCDSNGNAGGWLLALSVF